jgi:hypothetical protein
LAGLCFFFFFINLTLTLTKIFPFFFSFQHIVKSYQDLSPDGFWDKFSVNGKHMTYTAIIKCLRQERTAADKLLADQAKREYGDEFASKFNYRCGNQILVMKMDQKIAERYRMLHPHISS